MDEETQQPNEPTPNDATELATLRVAFREEKDKNKARKKKISELEALLAERESTIAAKDRQLTEANASLHELTVGAPLRDMSEAISIAPELWTRLFKERYSLQLKDGALRLLTSDGQPVQKDGKDVPFEHKALVSLLTDKEHPDARTFSAILIGTRASGSMGQPTKSEPAKPTPPIAQFGLR